MLLEEVVMTLDEFEALRLADLEQFYHERAARQMRVSRPTFSRILDAAHAKVADALVHGKSIRNRRWPRAGPDRSAALLPAARRRQRAAAGAASPPCESGLPGGGIHVKVCIPVSADQGIASPVCAHFGSAPFFLIVNAEDGTCRAIPNRNLHHAHGLCQPLQAIQGEDIDAIVVGGIGMGALNKLLTAGLHVFQARHQTVELTLAALKAGELPAMSPDAACAHRGQGHGHGHAHSHRHAHGQ